MATGASDMYDLLLKWGLDSLSKATLNKSDQELSIMHEAIRAKNNLVAERIRFAWNTSQSIIALALEAEDAQDDLKATFRTTIGRARPAVTRSFSCCRSYMPRTSAG